MSELLPDENPLVFEAELIVHETYGHYTRLRESYEDARDNGLIFSALGAAGLVVGGLVAQYEPSRFDFAPRAVGYLYLGAGAVSLAGGLVGVAKAGFDKIRLRRAL